MTSFNMASNRPQASGILSGGYNNQEQSRVRWENASLGRELPVTGLKVESEQLRKCSMTLLRGQCSRAETAAASFLSGPGKMEIYT